MTLVVKNLPANAGDIRDAVQSLGWKIAWRGNGNTPDSLAWRIPWTEQPGGLQSIELQRVGHD